MNKKLEYSRSQSNDVCVRWLIRVQAQASHGNSESKTKQSEENNSNKYRVSSSLIRRNANTVFACVEGMNVTREPVDRLGSFGIVSHGEAVCVRVRVRFPSILIIIIIDFCVR